MSDERTEHSDEIGQPHPFDEHIRMWADEFYDFIGVQSHDEAAAARMTEAKKPTVPEHSEEIASLCEHGSMACPDCDGVDDVRSVGQVIHGVECYEAWRDGQDCPHEQEEGE